MKKIILTILIFIISISITGSFVLSHFEEIERNILANDLLSVIDPKELQDDLLDFINWILYDGADNFINLKFNYFMPELLIISLLLIITAEKLKILYELISDHRDKFTKIISWIPPPANNDA